MGPGHYNVLKLKVNALRLYRPSTGSYLDVKTDLLVVNLHEFVAEAFPGWMITHATYQT